MKRINRTNKDLENTIDFVKKNCASLNLSEDQIINMAKKMEYATDFINSAIRKGCSIRNVISYLAITGFVLEADMLLDASDFKDMLDAVNNSETES